MSDRSLRTRKEAVEIHLKVLSKHSPAESKKTHWNLFIIVKILSAIRTEFFSNKIMLFILEG
jgi:hypothetical protein